MAKDTYYFSHDYNARNDPKLKRLIARHGMAGLGVFWSIVEDLYNNANALPTDYDCIAFDLRCDTNLVESIVNDFDLFVFYKSDFGSTSIERRLNERNEKSQKAKISANIRWAKVREDAKAMRRQCEGNAIKERKGKEINEKKEKKTNETPFDESKVPHAECMKIYCDWILKTTGATANIDGRQGKALKSILEWLSKQEKVAGDRQKIIDSWKWILDSWDKIEFFLQKQKTLSQIKSNLTNITDQLKNGIPKPTFKPKQEAVSNHNREQLSDLARRMQERAASQQSNGSGGAQNGAASN